MAGLCIRAVEEAQQCRSILVSAVASSIGMTAPSIMARIERLDRFGSKGRSRRVAFMRDTAVGFIDWDEEQIAWLMVHQAHQRQGIGAALLNRLKEERDLVIRVLCVSDNKKALDFYLREGFHIVKSGIVGRMFGVEFDNYLLSSGEEQEDLG